MKADDIKVGDKLNLGRGVIATVTGTSRHGFKAEQEYKGRTHELLIPFNRFDNPHYDISRV